MALVATTLASAKNTNDLRVTLTSATGVANKMLALIDLEWTRVTDVQLAPTISVVPGYNGTPAGPHGILAPVIYGRTDEFLNVGIQPGSAFVSQSFGASGAITGPAGTGVPTANTIVYINKATAAAMTLADPSKDQTNTIIFISTTAAAHTITYTAGFYANTTSSDVATAPATANAMFTIRAFAGVWGAVATADDGWLIG